MKHLIIVVLFMSMLLSACAVDAAPMAVSDSDQSYKMGSEIPVDDNVYVVSGQVAGDINSLTEVNAQGYTSGSMYGGYGYVGGSFAMWQEGKGFVRLKVDSISPYSDLASAGDFIILKTTDQKIRALLPGDRVTFKCRAQFEAIAAVRENETFYADKTATWELDYCRMVTPQINIGVADVP